MLLADDCHVNGFLPTNPGSSARKLLWVRKGDRRTEFNPRLPLNGAAHTGLNRGGKKMKRLNSIRIFGGGRSAPPEFDEPSVSRVKRPRNEQPVTGMKTALKLVLFVEDDPQMREFGLLVLRGAGYDVAAADTAAQAQRLWERHRGRIDLLLTDMMIPTCSTGLELARRFRRDNPQLPVIITSGFGPEIAGDQAAELKDLVFLRKPFRGDELLRVISASLRAPVH